MALNFNPDDLNADALNKLHDMENAPDNPEFNIEDADELKYTFDIHLTNDGISYSLDGNLPAGSDSEGLPDTWETPDGKTHYKSEVKLTQEQVARTVVMEQALRCVWQQFHLLADDHKFDPAECFAVALSAKTMIESVERMKARNLAGEE